MQRSINAETLQERGTKTVSIIWHIIIIGAHHATTTNAATHATHLTTRSREKERTKKNHKQMSTFNGKYILFSLQERQRAAEDISREELKPGRKGRCCWEMKR